MAETNSRANNTARTAPRGPGGPGRGPGGGPIMPGEKAKDFGGTLRRLISFMRPQRKAFMLGVLAIVVASVCQALGPRLIGFATNEITRGMLDSAGGINFGLVGRILTILAVVYTTGSAMRFFQQFTMAGVAQRTMYSLREAVDKKLSKLPLKYYDMNTFGDILSRVTNDVDTVASSLQQCLTQIISSVLSIIAVVTMMLVVSPLLMLIALVTVPLTAIFAKVVMGRSQGLFKGQQRSLGALNGHVEEMYSGHNIVKAFGQEQASIDKFKQINDELYNHGWKAQFISGMMQPVTNFFGNLGYVLVALAGSYMVVDGRLLVGDIQSFIQYLRQFTNPISEIANIANLLQSTIAAAERVFELLDEQEEVAEAPEPIDISGLHNEIVFENVRFGYNPEQVVIKNLSLNVKAGERVALVGPTGAGKTTLVNLIMRFYDVDSGSITIDGVDVRDTRRHALRSMMGMVLQDTWLFKGSIYENIAYGSPNATPEQVKAAAKSARAHPFIKQLPGGYEFQLKEDAANISQGQRQLITIARAILQNPSILILDEATSSVDTRTELLIQQGMLNLMENRTSFVIAHRLSTIRDADVILVVNDGDIIEQGSHSDLMASGGFYANLYNSQFAQENAAGL